jgi:DNA-binding response OmpR family regulator
VTHKHAGRRVLVVDDDPAIVSLVEAALTAVDMAVVTATGVDAAWAAFVAEGPFDAVLVDRSLRGRDGQELADRFCAAGQPAARVMLMSGFHNEPSGYGLLAKPFSLAALVAAVEHLLREPMAAPPDY